MKKIYLLPVLFFALMFQYGCEPMEDVYNEMDKDKDPYNESIEVSIASENFTDIANYYLLANTTVEDTAKANAIKSDKAFSETNMAATFIPSYLKNTYKALNTGSSANVSYDYNMGRKSYLAGIETASDFSLKTDDYAVIGGVVAEAESFFPSYSAADFIPTILENKYPDAEDGDQVSAKYYYSPIDGASSTFFLSEGFDSYGGYDVIGASDDWTQEFEAGNREWQAREFSGNAYAQFSAYKSGEQVTSTLISPKVNIGSSDCELSFDINIGYWNHDGLTVLISKDYDGSNYATATWDDVTSSFSIPQEPTDAYGDFASAGALSLDDYSGAIYIAFKYDGNSLEDKTTTFQIDNVVVKTSGIDKYSRSSIFEFDGSKWSIPNNVFVVNAEDYDAMGAPGKYDSFSSSKPAENFVPQFLAVKKPYAQLGDTSVVVYRYFSGGTSDIADLYEYDGSVWAKHNEIVNMSEQYVYGSNGWIFDPTVTFEMGSSDYKFIVDYVKENVANSSTYVDSYGTAEYYYGASSHYSNFDLRLSKKEDYSIPGYDGLSEDEAIELAFARMKEAIGIMLMQKYPEALKQVGGVDVFYNVTVATYENDLTKKTYSYKFQCTKSAPSPEFTFIEMN